MPLEAPRRITRAFVERGCGSNRRDREALARVVLRMVEGEVRAALTRNAHARDRGLLHELVQDATTLLYANDAKAIRAWKEEVATFQTYVAVITRRQVARRLSHFRGNPIALTPVEPQSVDMLVFDDRVSPETELLYRRQLERVSDFIESRCCSALDRSRFQALFVDNVTTSDLAESEGVSVDAIHAWRSRFRLRIGKALPAVRDWLRERARACRGPAPSNPRALDG